MNQTFAIGEDAKLAPLRRFLASDRWNVILMVLALIPITCNQYIYGTVAFLMIAAFIMLVSDDLISLLLPTLLIASFAIQGKNSFSEWISVIPFAFIPIAAGIAHGVLYSCKRTHTEKVKTGVLSRPALYVSIAVFLGGVGIISPKEYFSKTSLLNMFMIGFMIFFVYRAFSSHIGPGKNYTKHMDVRLSKIMCVVTVYLALAVVEYYAEHWAVFIADPDILAFQWRNNASTLLMIAMPFTFYMGTKKFRYFGISLLSFATILFSGSRGGLIFGGIEFLMLVIYFAVVDKKHRKAMLSVLGVIVLGCAALSPKLLELFRYTIGRFTSSGQYDIRLGLVKRSVEDFKANPLFGRGLGYMGNRDLHASARGALCWYHSSLPQIWGSFGIVGILAYGYQFYCRLKLMVSRHSLFGRTILLSFIGLEMMSLVNPGIFSALYLLILTVLLIVDERYTFESMEKYSEKQDAAPQQSEQPKTAVSAG